MPRLLLLSCLLVGCTTYLKPVQCTGGPHRCNDMDDALFCEYAVVSASGSQCEASGIGPQKHFCVVSKEACVDTSFALKGRDCRVTQYEGMKEAGECSPGTPIFVDP